MVEERSTGTVAEVERLLGDPRFELLRVPDSMPRTKPKALNYALPFVRGAHVVVYDAEDVPEPDQLRKAASAFAADHRVDCLQAELIVDNASENPLASLFAGEYAGQFGLMLPLLSRWRLPMPLGGTSNHFLTRSLREVAGWDAYNVTEDADLGVRLARLRYRTATLRSRTHEEAPLTLKAWMAQRTRWMKGWMHLSTENDHHVRSRGYADVGALNLVHRNAVATAPLPKEGGRTTGVPGFLGTQSIETKSKFLARSPLLFALRCRGNTGVTPRLHLTQGDHPVSPACRPTRNHPRS